MGRNPASGITLLESVKTIAEAPDPSTVRPNSLILATHERTGYISKDGKWIQYEPIGSIQTRPITESKCPHCSAPGEFNSHCSHCGVQIRN